MLDNETIPIDIVLIFALTTFRLDKDFQHDEEEEEEEEKNVMRCMRLKRLLIIAYT